MRPVSCPVEGSTGKGTHWFPHPSHQLFHVLGTLAAPRVPPCSWAASEQGTRPGSGGGKCQGGKPCQERTCGDVAGRIHPAGVGV